MCGSLRRKRSKQALDSRLINSTEFGSRSRTTHTTKECIRFLGQLAGSTPMFGSHLQAVLDTIALIVTKIEEIQEWEECCSALLRKLGRLLKTIAGLPGMDASNPANLDDVDELKRDLSQLSGTLENLLANLEKISKQKIGRVLNFLLISFRHRQLQDLEDQVDESINTFILKSTIHMRFNLNKINNKAEQAIYAIKQEAERTTSSIQYAARQIIEHTTSSIQQVVDAFNENQKEIQTKPWAYSMLDQSQRTQLTKISHSLQMKAIVQYTNIHASV